MRPEIIERLHKAKYELNWAVGGRKDILLKEYYAICDEAAQLYKTNRQELMHACKADFWKWIKENKLRFPPIKYEKHLSPNAFKKHLDNLH